MIQVRVLLTQKNELIGVVKMCDAFKTKNHLICSLHTTIAIN